MIVMPPPPLEEGGAYVLYINRSVVMLEGHSVGLLHLEQLITQESLP